MKLRVLAFALAILAFFIFVGSPFGQTAKAIVGVDDALIAILIAALAAVGITFVTSGAFSSTQEYVSSLLEEFAESQNVSVGSLFSGVDTGVNKQGKLLLNNRFVLLVDTFARWIKAKFSLVNNDDVVLQTGGNFLGNLVCYSLPIIATLSSTGSTKLITNTVDGAAKVYCLLMYTPNGSSYDFAYVPISDRNTYAEFTVRRFSNSAGTGLQYENTTTYYLTKDNYTSNSINITDPACYYAVIMGEWSQIYPGEHLNIQNPVYYTGEEISTVISTIDDVRATDQMGVNTGVILPPMDDNDYSEGDGAILDVGGYWGESYTDITEDTIPGAFEDSNIANTSITYESEETVEDQVEESQSEAQPVSQEVSDYQVNGLVSVFPFCIPFDLYNFVACLAADPVAPSFTWRFYVPGICDESIEIDLSEFDAAAQILRTMELLLFCVGLAFVTRKIIRG